MRRLVITHGERTIRHEIGDGAVVLGRDPACDLFFADQRLSRRHARFEPAEEGIRLSDLGSRNGCWVGSKRITETVLKAGDKVLLGSLVIVVEEDPPPVVAGGDPDASATIVLGAAASDEDGTVVLSKEEMRAHEPAPSPKPPQTPRVPTAPPPRTNATVLLGRATKPETPADTGTRILEAPPAAVARTSVLTPQVARDAIGSPPPESPHEPQEPDEQAPPSGIGSSLSWSAKLLLLTTALGLVIYFVLAFPLMRTLGNALREESLRRGRVLLDLVSAQNGSLVGEGRLRDLSVDTVLREERVKEALLLDLDGNVLAPSSRADEPLGAIPGIDAPIAEIRTFYLGRRASGDYVMVQPLLHQSRRVGLAVLVYEAASASASWALTVLFLAFLVMMLGVLTALVLAKRMTLAPLANLRDDVEAVVKGDAAYLPSEQAFPELSELARSVNRLIARAAASRRTPAPAPPATPAAPSAPFPVPAAGPEPTPRYSPVPPTPAPVDPAPVAGSSPRVAAAPAADGAKLWVDEGFIVTRVEDSALPLLGVTASVEGKHLIEAVSEQRLLEAILDAVNALESASSASATAALSSGTVSVTATRDGASVVVSLSQL